MRGTNLFPWQGKQRNTGKPRNLEKTGPVFGRRKQGPRDHVGEGRGNTKKGRSKKVQGLVLINKGKFRISGTYPKEN